AVSHTSRVAAFALWTHAPRSRGLPCGPRPSPSEVKLQPELDVARSLRTRYLAKRRAGYTATGRVEDGSVRQVDEFRPELEPLRFRYRELLLDAQIEFAEAGADDSIVAAASKSAGRLGEGG